MAEVEMAAGAITRDANVHVVLEAGVVTHACPGSALGLSECNWWQRPEGRHPMVLIFRGLRSARAHTHCAH